MTDRLKHIEQLLLYYDSNDISTKDIDFDEIIAEIIVLYNIQPILLYNHPHLWKRLDFKRLQLFTEHYSKRIKLTKLK